MNKDQFMQEYEQLCKKYGCIVDIQWWGTEEADLELKTDCTEEAIDDYLASIDLG